VLQINVLAQQRCCWIRLESNVHLPLVVS